jgi:hypothetical protein
VVYSLLSSTQNRRVIELRERDAGAFKLEYADFVRMPWHATRAHVHAGPGGALLVKPPRLFIGHSTKGTKRHERRVNDQKLLTPLGQAALERPGAVSCLRSKRQPERDSIVWEMQFRCRGTLGCFAVDSSGRGRSYACCMQVFFPATVAQVAAGLITITIDGWHHPTTTYAPPAPCLEQKRTREERDQIRALTAAGSKPERVRSLLHWEARRVHEEMAMHAAGGGGAAATLTELPAGTVPSKAYVQQVQSAGRRSFRLGRAEFEAVEHRASVL